MILPDSRVTSWPSSAFNSRDPFPSWRTGSPRPGPGVPRHFSKASCARVIVCSYSTSVALRTRPSSLPSIGENFSMIGPLPDQSPLKTPGFSASIPSLLRSDCIRHRLALGAQQIHRFVDNLGRDIERGAETNRVVAGFQNEQTAIEKAFPKFVALFGIGQVESNEEPASADRGDDGLLALQLLERLEEMLADHSRVLDQIFLLEYSQEMGPANHGS